VVSVVRGCCERYVFCGPTINQFYKKNKKAGIVVVMGEQAVDVVQGA
jgi:hypothetical protein